MGGGGVGGKKGKEVLMPSRIDVILIKRYTAELPILSMAFRSCAQYLLTTKRIKWQNCVRSLEKSTSLDNVMIDNSRVYI